MTSNHEAAFFDFLEEYAQFLEKLDSDEKEKLAALMSNSIERIEHAISVGQANAMQIENLERRRVRLQEKAGYAGMTFSEIVECAPDEERVGLDALMRRIVMLVENVQYQSKKSVGVANDHLRMSNVMPQPAADAPGQASAYLRANEKTRRPSISMLETKI